MSDRARLDVQAPQKQDEAQGQPYLQTKLHKHDRATSDNVHRCQVTECPRLMAMYSVEERSCRGLVKTQAALGVLHGLPLPICLLHHFRHFRMKGLPPGPHLISALWPEFIIPFSFRLPAWIHKTHHGRYNTGRGNRHSRPRHQAHHRWMTRQYISQS